MTRDPLEALDTLIALGVDRVLTSGQSKSALEGLGCIRTLVERAADALTILPGGGIRPGNVAQIVAGSGVHEVHGSAGGMVESPMSFRNPRCTMGGVVVPGEFERVCTDPEKIREMVAALRVLD